MWIPFVLTLVAILVARIVWRRVRYDVHKIPSPPEHFLFGHGLAFLFRREEMQLTRWIREHHEQLGRPKLMKIRVFSRILLMVFDGALCKEILLTKTQPYAKRVTSSIFIFSLIGGDPRAKNMFLGKAVSPYIKTVRRVYASAFQSDQLRRAMPKLNKVLDRVIDKIKSNSQREPFDCQELFVRMTLDVIGEVAFDTNLGGLDGSHEFYQLLIDVGHIGRSWSSNPFPPVIARLFPNSKAGRGLRKIRLLTSKWDWLTKRILHKEDPDDGDTPIWFGLKHLIDPDTKKSLAYKSLLAEVATVVITGMDSTGHQLAVIFALLATHPQVVERLIEELKTHGLFGCNARDVTFEDLGDLTYLTAIVKEGMRIAHVLASSFIREATRDMVLAGYRIPKGSSVLMPGNRAVPSAADWGDPENFRPERWLADEDMSDKYNLGFLKGPRDCVGQRLAMLEMRLTLLKLIRQFDFTLIGTFEDLIKSSRDGLVIEAGNGVWVHATTRVQTSK